jgi:hypothetical protein
VFQVQDADQEVPLAQICPSVPEGSFDSSGIPATCIDETKNDTAPTIVYLVAALRRSKSRVGPTIRHAGLGTIAWTRGTESA